jgi:transcription elongation GreA/GreB family factor
MSRAFVKELDADAPVVELPERPPDPHPNYMTPSGFRASQGRLQALSADRAALLAQGEDLSTTSQVKTIERELRHLRQRLERAVVVNPAEHVGSEVRFGATVTLADEEGGTHAFTIVGEDEVCAARGAISWLSPLARALLGRRTGDRVEWERPVGTLELEITAVCYWGA